MKTIMKKCMPFMVSILFMSLSFAPALNAEMQVSEERYPVRIISIDEIGIWKTETFQVTEVEVNELQDQLFQFQQLAKDQMSLKEIFDLLMQVFNTTNYPVLSRILSRILDTDLLLKGKLVVSKGWSKPLNPFTDGKISMTKLVSWFRYREDMTLLNIPSTTTIINLDPFELDSYSGNHVCYLFKFKGIFLHIIKPFPQQSFRYILGVSRFASAFEI